MITYLSGSILSSRFWYLNRAVSSQIYKKYNLQRASAELAMCTVCIDGCWVGPRALLHALRHYMLRVKIKSVDFSLAVSTWTAKLPNLIPCQIFSRLYSTSGCSIHVTVCQHAVLICSVYMQCYNIVFLI